MAEDPNNQAEADGKDSPEPRGGPVGGERLAAARREQQISVLEIAKELHLDEAKVRALERNEFDVLGAPVFAKGHLRKYAQLVGVDEADVFADYYKMTHTAQLPPVVIKRRRVRRELSPGPWIAVIIVILVAAVAYWWLAVYTNQSGATTRGAVETAPGMPLDATEGDAGPAVREMPAAELPAGDSLADSATEQVSEQRAAAPPDRVVPETATAGGTRLTLRFSGDCWTEISDATGRRLFFDMGRAGRGIELSGQAPFTVLFGNVENVTVLVNGADYPLVPDSPGSRTARLTIQRP